MGLYTQELSAALYQYVCVHGSCLAEYLFVFDSVFFFIKSFLSALAANATVSGS